MRATIMKPKLEELADLHGLSFAVVFKKLVLEHPSVVPAGRKVIEQTGKHASVFEQGHAPGPIVNYHWDLNTTADSLALQFVGQIVSFWESPPPKPSVAIIDAATALVARIQYFRQLLTEKQLIAKGTYFQTGQTTEVGHLEWARRGTLIDVLNSDLLEVINHKLTTKWSGISIEVANLKTIRELAGRKAIVRVESSGAAVLACTRWLVGVMNESPHKRRDNKQIWKKRAKDKWPKTLTGRGFDKAWTDAVVEAHAPAWAAAGAPQKSSQQSVR